VLGLVAFAVWLYLFGTGHQTGGAIAVAILAAAAGAVWVLTQHRRVDRVEARWAAEHPGTRVETPTA